MSLQLPSQTTNRAWLYANNPIGEQKTDPRLSGKIMIFPDKKDMDSYWLLIRNATMEDELGYSAKCSTGMENPDAIFKDKGFIAIYTTDYNDFEEIVGIETTLRKLVGCNEILYYKADEDTMKENDKTKFTYRYKLDGTGRVFDENNNILWEKKCGINIKTQGKSDPECEVGILNISGCKVITDHSARLLIGCHCTGRNFFSSTVGKMLLSGGLVASFVGICAYFLKRK